MNLRVDNLQELFRIALELRQGLARLERESERVQQIAMNAAVAAGQTGRHLRVYSEIANQIAFVARRMKTHVGSCRVEVNAIVNLILTALTMHLRLVKYEQAAVGVHGVANKRLLAEVIHSLSTRIRDVGTALFRRLRPAEAALRNVRQTQYRLFGAANALRVEAISLSGPQASAVDALVDALVDAIDRGLAEVDEQFRITQNLAECSRLALRGRGDDHDQAHAA